MTLYIFDLDGTLVEDHLIDGVCPSCDGTGLVAKHQGRDPELCPRCKGKRSVLMPRTDRHYTDPELLRGVSERLDELAPTSSSSFAIATNQGGVALGYQTSAEVWRRISRSLELVDFFSRAPFSIHVATAYPGQGHPTPAELYRRKPEPGMLIEAMLAHRAEAVETVFVGDRETDLTAAENAGVRFVHARRWLQIGALAFSAD